MCRLDRPGLVHHLLSDARYALVGAGREPLTPEEVELLGPLAERIPLFG